MIDPLTHRLTHFSPVRQTGKSQETAVSDASDASDAQFEKNPLRGQSVAKGGNTGECSTGGNYRKNASGASGASDASDARARRAERPQPLALVVADIAERVARLAPDRRDPERFHLEKHTLAAELRRLAADLRRAAA